LIFSILNEVASSTRSMVSVPPRNGFGLIGSTISGKVDFECRSLAGFAVDTDRATALLDDTENGRQTQGLYLFPNLSLCAPLVTELQPRGAVAFV